MQETTLRSWKKAYENDLAQIVYEAKEILETPALILLEGDLGAGKTSFAKAFCQTSDENALSPTYSIINELGDIAHGDLYRIEDAQELMHIELNLYLEEKNYLLLEWGRKHLSTLHREVPEDFSFYLLQIDILSNDSRNYTLSELKGY